MADYVSIANLALSAIGEPNKIRSPDEDSHAARTIRAVWDQVRQAVLRDHPWNFAMMRAELAAATAPGIIFPWMSLFPLPDLWLRLFEILYPPCAIDHYSLEAGGILADTAGPLRIRYLADVPETGKWDAMFTAAFAGRLAFTIADDITGDLNRKQAAWSAYRSALSDARGADAKENPPVEPEEDDWVLARLR